MARDDRERNFEDALARSLQANLSAKTSAGARSSAPAPQDTCPDAEILAAYHERLLDPEEMISRKEHITSCVRCQEVLAQLEVTDGIPLEIDREELAPRSAVVVPQPRVVQVARASAGPVAQATVAKSSSPIEMPRRSGTWRWLVPAGTIAASLLIWVAIHERTPQQTESEVAKNQPQATPEIAPASSFPADNLTKEKSGQNGAPVPPAAKNGGSAKTDAFDRAENGVREQKAPVPSAVPNTIAPRGDLAAGDSIAPEERARMQSRILAQSPSRVKQLTKDESVQSPTSVPLAAPDAATNTVSAAPSAASETKREATAGGVAAAPTLKQPQATSAGAVAFREAANLRTGQNPVVVSSPDGVVIWRLLPSGIIQYSADAGGNWTLQKTAVIADLLAGSAPADKICWVVGRGGSILLTADGGKHWLKLSSPTTDDIAGIFAVNGQQATITTATNKSYKTTDGGTSWTPQPNP